MYPVAGGFYTYSTRFVDPSWGFAMGWNYVFQWAIVLPFELVVASLTVGYWNADINIAVWISIFLLTIIAINVFGVLGFAEEEFWAAIIKLSAIVIFMIIALVLGELRGRYSRILLIILQFLAVDQKEAFTANIGGQDFGTIQVLSRTDLRVSAPSLSLPLLPSLERNLLASPLLRLRILPKLYLGRSSKFFGVSPC